MFFRTVIEVFLLWWIISAISKWYKRIKSENNTKVDDQTADSYSSPGYQSHNIEDADFEEIK